MDALATVTAWRKAATDDPDGFWGRAAEELRWSKKWDRVLDWQPPTFRWYRGGRSNLAHNCLDHHVASRRGGAAPLITENERRENRTFPYAEPPAAPERISPAPRGPRGGEGGRGAR